MGFLDNIMKAAGLFGDPPKETFQGEDKISNAVKTGQAVEMGALKTINYSDFTGINASYEVPEVFGEFESHAEPEMCCMLGCDPMDESTFDIKKPFICLTPEDFAWDGLDEFELNGGNISSAREVSPVNMKYFMFKAKADYYKDQIVYWYGGRLIEDCYRALALIYDKKLLGTPLERQLTEVLDKAAQSYKES